MEIQKIFAEIDGTEKIYSVSMTEEEYNLYSESKKKEDSSSSTVKGAALVGGGIAANTALGLSLKTDKKGRGMLGYNIGNKESNKALKSEHEKIFKKLKKTAESQGTKVTETSNGEASYYVSKNVRKLYEKLGKGDQLERAGKAGDSILTGNRADLLAHELGHSQHYQKRAGSKLGKIAHRLHPVSQMGTASPLGMTASFANGFDSGKKSEKAKQQGKKESTWNKVRSVAVPVAVAAPLLVAEGAASKRGMKLIKEAGASKSLQKDAKTNLSKAWGTYASMTATNAGIGELGRAAGKASEKKKNEDKKKKS